MIGTTASPGSLSSRFLSPARAQLPDEGFARARCLTYQGEVLYDTQNHRIVSNLCRTPASWSTECRFSAVEERGKGEVGSFLRPAGEWIAPLSSAPWTCSTRRPRSRSGRSHSATSIARSPSPSDLAPHLGAAGVRRVVALRRPVDLDTVLSGTRAGLGETGRRQRDVTQSDRRRKRPTMKDVVEHARASASTVSSVLNDSGPVTPERRNRVRWTPSRCWGTRPTSPRVLDGASCAP